MSGDKTVVLHHLLRILLLNKTLLWWLKWTKFLELLTL